MGNARRDVEPVAQVSEELGTWVADLGRVLQMVDAVLDECQLPPGTPDSLKATAVAVRPMVRQCRAGLPTPDILRRWVEQVAASHP